MDFLETILSGPICSDSPTAIIERSSTTADEVTGIQQLHLEAGARLIHTTSPFATPSRLKSPGKATHAANEINWQAAQLARLSTKGHRDAWVAGLIVPSEIESSEFLATDLREQMGALLDGGVQLIHLFGFHHLADLEVAITIKHELHHCPVIVTLPINPASEFASEDSLLRATARLTELDADVIGLDHVSESTVEAIRTVAPDVPLAIETHEALPHEGISRLLNLGASILECSSPDNTAAVAAALRKTN